MLADKSGLREKGTEIVSKGDKKPLSDKEKEDIKRRLFSSIEKQTETDSDKAERIRNELKSSKNERR